MWVLEEQITIGEGSRDPRDKPARPAKVAVKPDTVAGPGKNLLALRQCHQKDLIRP